MNLNSDKREASREVYMMSVWIEVGHLDQRKQCDDNNEEEGYKSININKRTSSQEIVIIPNPNTGQFVISGCIGLRSGC